MTIKATDNTIAVVPATERAPSQLSISAKSSLQALYEHAACPRLLQRTLCGSLSWLQRSATTLAQALLSPNLAPGWIAALLAVDARVVYGDEKERKAPLSDLLGGRGLHGRRLQSLHLSIDVPGFRWGEAHVARMPADQPIVTAVATAEVSDAVVRRARLALAGVWHENARLAEAAGLLVDHPPNDERVEAVAQAVGTEVAPAGDFLASVTYRRAMAITLTRRALHQCQMIRQGESNG